MSTFVYNSITSIIVNRLAAVVFLNKNLTNYNELKRIDYKKIRFNSVKFVLKQTIIVAKKCRMPRRCVFAYLNRMWFRARTFGHSFD